MIGLLLLSIGMTTLAAFFIAFGFYFISPNLAYAIFWITFGFEWIVMEPLNRILRIKSIREEGKTFDKLTKYEKVVGKQAVALECEYCNESNAIKLDLNKLNTFDCKKCGNGNKVILQFSTVRITNPLDTIESSNDDAIEELDE